MSEIQRTIDSELDASLRTLFDAIDEGFALCDMVVDELGISVDYRFVLVNPLFEEMTGLVNAAGKTALELIPNLEREWIDTYSRVAFGQEAMRFEQGSEVMGRWFEVFAAPLPPHGRFAVVFKDQTARRRWEQTLKRSADNSAFVAELLSALDVQDTFAARVQHLTDSIAGRFAEYATVEAPRRSSRLLSLSHVTDDGAEILRTLRTQHRIPEADTASVYQATEKPQLIRVISPEMRAAYSTSPAMRNLLDRLDPTSHIAVPIELGAGERGVLMVGTAGPDGRHFDADDLGFFQDVARRVSPSLVSARLREEEHNISVRLQKALLPDRVIAHPEVLVGARYQAANVLLEVGGDWYDTFSWSDGKVGFIVGDVVGHGIDSTAAMGRLRAATAALAAHLPPDPAGLIDALDTFARSSDGSDFVTVVCLVLDPATGNLSYSSAGHPPCLVVEPNGLIRFLDDAQAPPMCGLTVVDRPKKTITLMPGSTVVLYSDGLVERRRENLDIGLARLEEAAVKLSDLPMDRFASELIDAMGQVSAPQDDVIVLGFRYTPGVGRFCRSVLATADQLRGLRNELRTWLRMSGVSGGQETDVVLAVGEACSNTIEHAYLREVGPVIVEVTNYGVLRAVVSDQGTWKAPSLMDGRGRGTTIMRELSDFSRLQDQDGTVVIMRFESPSPG